MSDRCPGSNLPPSLAHTCSVCGEHFMRSDRPLRVFCERVVPYHRAQAPHCPAKPRNRPGGTVTPDETAQAIHDAGWSCYVSRERDEPDYFWQAWRTRPRLLVEGRSPTHSAALHAAHTAMTEAL